MECDNRFYLYTGHKFLCTISSTSVTIKKSPLSQISELSVSKEGPRILRLRIGSCISLQRELQLRVPISGWISLLADLGWVLSCLVLKLGCLRPVWGLATSLGA